VSSQPASQRRRPLSSQGACSAFPNTEMPRDNARHVITGAEQLSPHLGIRMLASKLLGRSAILRELFS
jgi:hypothetical protein